MATLVYTVALNGDYPILAELLVRSLRAGGVAGEIIVLGAAQLDVPARSVVITREKLLALNMTGPDALYLRAVVDQLVPDALDFDYLVHLDADVLCCRPVDRILEDLARRRVIAVQQYRRPLSAVGQNFTAADWGRVRGNPFAACGGIVGFPGGEAGRDLLRLWDFECRARRFDDQTALNVVLHRAYAGRFEWFPGAGFWPEDSDAALVHFLGYRAEMSGAFQRLSANTVRGVAPVGLEKKPRAGSP